MGKSLGAVGCFVIAQQAKPLVERLMRRHRRLRALERTVHAHPLKATLLVRFSMLPAPIKNYGWGSLGVDFRIFLVATLLEVLPLHYAPWLPSAGPEPSTPPTAGPGPLNPPTACGRRLCMRCRPCYWVVS